MGSRTNSARARGQSVHVGERKPQLGSDIDNPELSKSQTKKNRNRASINLGKTANIHSKVILTSPDQLKYRNQKSTNSIISRRSKKGLELNDS